jgi:hypothetical protein
VSGDPIIDLSRIDAHLAATRRAMLLREMWKPMAAGAVGALAVVGAVYVTLPRFSTKGESLRPLTCLG